jgi:hypothetical protein
MQTPLPLFCAAHQLQPFPPLAPSLLLWLPTVCSAPLLLPCRLLLLLLQLLPLLKRLLIQPALPDESRCVVGACTVAAAVSAEHCAMKGVCMPAARGSAIQLLQQRDRQGRRIVSNTLEGYQCKNAM